jgi:hypothetical protein
VGVEPTIRSAQGRIGGFEGRDSHRTIFASSWIIDHHDRASALLAELLALIRWMGTAFSRVLSRLSAWHSAQSNLIRHFHKRAIDTLQL